MIDFSTFKKLTIGGVELKQLFINGIQVWKSGYTNLVPTAIDTDGSIYNDGKGYIDGYRNSSSGALKSQSNTVTTGFIKATKNDVVRMAGTKWNQTTGYNYFAVYDANFNLIDTINYNSGSSGSTRGWDYNGQSKMDTSNTYVYVENNVTRFAIAMKSGYEYAYIRISAYGVGADMIVTVNEEIE